MPQDMICQDCQASVRNGKSPSNILTCAFSHHARPVQADVVNAAEAWVPNLSIRGLGAQLSVHLSLMGSFVTDYQPALDEDDTPMVFDTFTGSCRPKEDTDQIVSPSSESSCYIMQTLNICSEACLTFYDSGANTHLVQARLAEEAGFHLLSRNSVCFQVAGGGEVF
jgi:hypothetical protein